MKNIVLFLALSINCHLFAQNNFDSNQISNQTKKIVKKIEKKNQLMDSAVGFSGYKPKQWENFEELKARASKSELIELTNHPNGVVRSYSFWALSHDSNIDLFSIVKKHLTDNELIYTQFGCIIMEEKVGDFFIMVMTPEYVDLESKKLNQKELYELDSLLIYLPNKLSSKFGALNRAEATNKIYPKIRELVVMEKNQNALVTLAKFQKDQDIEIIKNFISNTKNIRRSHYFTYSAISEFPNQAFIPLLEENLINTLDDTHYSTEWRALYKAIASYKNEKAVSLLTIPFHKVQHKNIKKYHIEFVFNAIMEYQDPMYDKLLWKIWEEENQISVQSYKYLLSLNPSRAYELTKKELIPEYQIQASDFRPNLENVVSSENLKEYFLNVLMTNDKRLSNKIIAHQIENANVHDIYLFNSKVNKQKIFIEPIFSRLEEESNPHIYFDLIETLINFKDDTINMRIL